MLRSVLIIKGQLQHVMISSDNQRSIYDMLRSVMTIKGQLQRITSHWQTLSYNVVSSTPRQNGIRTHNVSGDRHSLHRYICSYKSNLPYDNDDTSLIQEDRADLKYGLV